MTQLEQPEISLCGTIEIPEVEWEEEDVKIAEAIKIEVKITKGDVQVRVEGRIFAKLDANCSRCFEETRFEREIIFKADYVTRENFSKDLELELKEEDLDVSIFDGEKLDLAEIAREQILLSLPMQILCHDACKGLCSICWTNLNKQTCRCRQDEIQKRWAQLKSLN